MASDEDLKAEIERLRAENEALKKPRGQMSLKVSEKGGLSVYGLGRFPVTLYREQWEKLLGMADEIRTFIRENDRCSEEEGVDRRWLLEPLLLPLVIRPSPGIKVGEKLLAYRHRSGRFRCRLDASRRCLTSRRLLHSLLNRRTFLCRPCCWGFDCRSFDSGLLPPHGRTLRLLGGQLRTYSLFRMSDSSRRIVKRCSDVERTF